MATLHCKHHYSALRPFVKLYVFFLLFLTNHRHHLADASDVPAFALESGNDVTKLCKGDEVRAMVCSACARLPFMMSLPVEECCGDGEVRAMCEKCLTDPEGCWEYVAKMDDDSGDENEEEAGGPTPDDLFAAGFGAGVDVSDFYNGEDGDSDSDGGQYPFLEKRFGTLFLGKRPLYFGPSFMAQSDVMKRASDLDFDDVDDYSDVEKKWGTLGIGSYGRYSRQLRRPYKRWGSLGIGNGKRWGTLGIGKRWGTLGIGKRWGSLGIGRGLGYRGKRWGSLGIGNWKRWGSLGISRHLGKRSAPEEGRSEDRESSENVSGEDKRWGSLGIGSGRFGKRWGSLGLGNWRKRWGSLGIGKRWGSLGLGRGLGAYRMGKRWGSLGLGKGFGSNGLDKKWGSLGIRKGLSSAMDKKWGSLGIGKGLGIYDKKWGSLGLSRGLGSYGIDKKWGSLGIGQGMRAGKRWGSLGIGNGKRWGTLGVGKRSGSDSDEDDVENEEKRWGTLSFGKKWGSLGIGGGKRVDKKWGTLNFGKKSSESATANNENETAEKRWGTLFIRGKKSAPSVDVVSSEKATGKEKAH